jgi:hypothetical protein
MDHTSPNVICFNILCYEVDSTGHATGRVFSERGDFIAYVPQAKGVSRERMIGPSERIGPSWEFG